MKTCTKCGQTKSFEDFYRNKRYADGRYTWCKLCFREAQQQRYKENPEGVRETQYVWRRKNSDAVYASRKKAFEKRKADTGMTSYECSEHKKERMEKYRNEHREELRKKSRDRYHQIVHVDGNRAYWQAIVHRRRSRAGSISAEIIRELVSNSGGVCFYCGKPTEENYHIDHKLPVSRGGESDGDNLCISCPTCNLSKGAKTVEEFMGISFVGSR